MSHGTVILLCPQWEIFILRRLWAERCTPPCQAFSGMLLCSHCLYSKCVTDWASPEPSIFPAQHLPSPCPFLQHPFISKQCLLQKRSQNLRLGTHQSKSRHHICTPPPMQLNVEVFSWKSEEIVGKYLVNLHTMEQTPSILLEAHATARLVSSTANY